MAGGGQPEDKTYRKRLLKFHSTRSQGVRPGERPRHDAFTRPEEAERFSNVVMRPQRQLETDHGNRALGFKMPVPGATVDSVAKASNFTPTFLGPHVTPIDVDRDSPTFALNSQERTKWLKELVEERMSRAGGGDEATNSALLFLHSKILEPELLSEAEKEFWINFISWLSGTPRTQEDKESTPWLMTGNRILSQNKDLTKVLKDVGKFVSIFGETRKEFERQLKELEIRLPTNINEAYLYYKYIVKKSGADFLSDFQYFKQAPIDI